MAEPVTTTTSSSSPAATLRSSAATAATVKGIRVNGTRHSHSIPRSPQTSSQYPLFIHLPNPRSPVGKNWKSPKTAFRPQLGLKTTWEQRSKARKHQELVKLKEKELRDEKEAVRQKHITTLKEKREKATEKARYAALAEKMHKKRVERLKRREKRNKALKER
ncbi:Cgr1 family-domain-containing protein [Tirmania nivea]|nr:Cgr1 family-domain-containing protein [Tirmania nivea]